MEQSTTSGGNCLWLLVEHARQIASQRVDRGVSRGVQGAWHGEVDKSRALFATN